MAPLPPKGQRVISNGNPILLALVMPLRLAIYVTILAIAVPITLLIQFIRAPLRRLLVGKPSQILHKPMKPAPSPDEYAYQLVFTKPLDVAKLKAAVLSVAADVGVDEKHVRVEDASEEYEPKPPADESAAITGAHYTGKGWLHDAEATGAAKLNISVRVFNAPEGQASIILGKGDGVVWDGSSNFNFAKEYLSRYVGNAPNEVNMCGKLEMTEAAKAAFDGESFLKFMFVTVPVATVKQLHSWAYRLSSVAPFCGGSGIDFKAKGDRLQIYNLSTDESAAFKRGAAALGCKPFAALTWSIVDAHNQVTGGEVNRICMQASLQSRCYQPKLERNLVGDWLVGPCQRIDGSYSPEIAQKEYESLVDQLNNPSTGSEVAGSVLAKAYGGMISGAAYFEPWATYPYHNGLLHNSVFFNNYGVRTMPDSLGLVSWNWCAPFFLGCNCININGKTCCAIASGFLGGKTVERIRDVFAENVQMFIQAGEGKKDQ